ncbi:corticoliberin-like [Acipenser oxyrinchus oxyrinchus]|uniref:Corticoliberin-like n=1 Tax=Acipenser oxyrinchus oxyrinchus TaxID=40147 RepID=A0AAD8GEF0_ACIOX|nr:corticoliberin-like [Acipenser oxyrinchus oxyrinchus]
MKLYVLVCTAVLLGAFLPRHESRAIESPGAVHSEPDPQSHHYQQSLPILVRLGEEYFIRLGSVNQNAPPSTLNAFPDASSATINRALQVQLTQRLLQGKVGSINRFVSSYGDHKEDRVEKGKRSEDPPISLDLTFHLLREVLEMARAEQLAQQAHSNRRMMELIGK